MPLSGRSTPSLGKPTGLLSAADEQQCHRPQPLLQHSRGSVNPLSLEEDFGPIVFPVRVRKTEQKFERVYLSHAEKR